MFGRYDRRGCALRVLASALMAMSTTAAAYAEMPVNPWRPRAYEVVTAENLRTALRDKPSAGERAVFERASPPRPPMADDDTDDGFSGGDDHSRTCTHCADCCRDPHCTLCRRGLGMGWLDNTYLFTSFDSFSGPLDLASGRGNFGTRYGAYSALPIAAGFGLEGGGSAGWYDFKGTQFTGNRVRFQNFFTAAATQRLFDDQIAFGFAHDWLYDRYFDALRFSQWRVKVAWQANECNQFGVWATIADRGSDGTLNINPPPNINHFRPFSQGVGYWQHQWQSSMVTQAYAGVAEEPGEWVFGGNGYLPLNDFWAVTANMHYVNPSARGGAPGFGEEAWNLSLGIQFAPGSALRPGSLASRPLFNVADNAVMGIGRY